MDAGKVLRLAVAGALDLEIVFTTVCPAARERLSICFIGSG